MYFDITVSREGFDLALKQVKKFNKGKKPFDIILKFDGSSLLLETPMATFAAMATGTSDVRIVLPGRMMILMQGTFPSIDSLTFYLKGTSLTIERLTIPCRVVE
jgi:hypothetical protein